MQHKLKDVIQLHLLQLILAQTLELLAYVLQLDVQVRRMLSVAAAASAARSSAM